MSELTHCPKCNTDLRGEDIYQFFLNEYTRKVNIYPRTIEYVLKSIKDYPSLYKNAPPENELQAMTEIELNAWHTAFQYGWTKENPKTFKKEIGIEINDRVAKYQCPECGHEWKR